MRARSEELFVGRVDASCSHGVGACDTHVPRSARTCHSLKRNAVLTCALARAARDPLGSSNLQRTRPPPAPAVADSHVVR